MNKESPENSEYNFIKVSSWFMAWMVKSFSIATILTCLLQRKE